MLSSIRNFINGLAFGITQIIPGLSGATIAIMLGFYFELLEAINCFFKDIRKNLKFLTPIFIGMIAGIIIFSSIVNFLLTNYSFPTMLFFIGLIAGILPHIYARVREDGTSGRRYEKLKIKNIVFIAIPFIILVIASFLQEASVTSPAELVDNIGIPFIIFLFVTGVLAAAALILPGFSGSFVLLLLGVYHLAIYSISSIRHLLLDFSNITLMLNIIKVLLPMGLGVIVGILSMAKLIDKLIKNYNKLLYTIIFGLLLGSIFALFREPIVYQSGVSALAIVIGVVTFVSGAVLAYVLGKKRL